jgi:small subunit ribosomal protein S1
MQGGNRKIMAKIKPVAAKQKTGAAYDLMNAALEQHSKQFTTGTIIKGKISGIKGNEVLVDIGYKSEGTVPSNDFADITVVKEGDEIDVLLEQLEGDNGMVVLSKSRADEKLRWDAILNKYTEGGVVAGTIRSKVRGGLIVDVDGVDAFLPGSQVDVTPPHELDVYLGQSGDFKVIKISNERRNIIVSRRELIEDRMADKKRELLGTIEKGQVRPGRVKNITDFGAFVDLDGLDGLLHITDMSWGRIKHPSEMLRVGQEVDVVILDVDMDRERVSLGLKQATPNPWENIDQTFPIGSRLRGKFVNLVPYGAFVEIQPGIEGLVHVSEFSWTKRVARASDVLNVGDEVDVVVKLRTLPLTRLPTG